MGLSGEIDAGSRPAVPANTCFPVEKKHPVEIHGGGHFGQLKRKHDEGKWRCGSHWNEMENGTEGGEQDYQPCNAWNPGVNTACQAHHSWGADRVTDIPGGKAAANFVVDTEMESEGVDVDRRRMKWDEIEYLNQNGSMEKRSDMVYPVSEMWMSGAGVHVRVNESMGRGNEDERGCDTGDVGEKDE